MYAPIRKVDRVEADLVRHVEGDGTRILGHCRHVHLDCGHLVHGNPTMSFKVGSFQACHTCKNETK